MASSGTENQTAMYKHHQLISVLSGLTSMSWHYAKRRYVRSEVPPSGTWTYMFLSLQCDICIGSVFVCLSVHLSVTRW